MAKAEASNKVPSNEIKRPKGFEGYEDKTEDMVGYWSEDAPDNFLHCIPRYAVLFDNKADSRNPSILIFATLLDPVLLLKKEDDEKSEFMGKPGDQIGIFAKPGMRRLAKLADCKVLIQRDMVKDRIVGVPRPGRKPMKMFKVMNEPEAVEKRLQVLEDRRKESFGRDTFLDAPGKPRKAPRSDTNGDSDDDDSGF